MVRAVFAINHPSGLFWYYARFTRVIEKFSKMHSGKESQIAFLNMGLLVLVLSFSLLYFVNMSIVNVFMNGKKVAKDTIKACFSLTSCVV